MSANISARELSDVLVTRFEYMAKFRYESIKKLGYCTPNHERTFADFKKYANGDLKANDLLPYIKGWIKPKLSDGLELNKLFKPSSRALELERAATASEQEIIEALDSSKTQLEKLITQYNVPEN